MRPTLLALALATLAACPPPPPKPTPTPTELTREDRLAFAQLEVQREAAVPKLIALADDRTPARRALALRALGRIGSPAAVAELRRRLIGEEGVLAAAALGMAGATGAIEPADARAIVDELTPMAIGPRRVAVLEAIGRLGTVAAQKPLASALGAEDSGVVIVAAQGLGRLGRAKVALDDTTELALIGLAKDGDAHVRYAATYALARAFVDPTAPPPAPTDPVVRALRDRLKDPEPTVRAVAVLGLAARKAVAATTPDLLDALADNDWRVAVELVRALGGPAGTDATRAALVPFLARLAQEWAAERLPPPFAHPLIEGLRQLGDRAAEPKTRELLVAIARAYTDTPPAQRPQPRQLAAAWIDCLALAALARPMPTAPSGDLLGDPAVAMAQLPGCAGGLLSDGLVQGVVFDAVAAGAPGDAARKLSAASASSDPQVAAAALDRIAAVAARLTPPERAPVRDALIAAVGRSEPAVAGAAADAAATFLTDAGSGGDNAPLARAVVARVDRAIGEAELTASLLDAIARAKLDGLPTCQRLVADPSPALRASARACITALTGTDPGPREPAGSPVRPPVDPDVALRAQGAWHLTTTAGELVIGLESTLAPWHVAAIITLTRNGYYDGLLFHRVVPDFVVQGGDPRGDGWGGPGYTLRDEINRLRYRRGAVGMALAGADTGGSQFFITLSPQPHLDGGYTVFGRVVAGEEVLARLVQGDRIVRVRELGPGAPGLQ